jgi:hypothetical protein
MKPDLVAVKGKDPYINTLRAIQELGGIEAFVRRGDRVGVLVNSPFKNIGASVNPDVALAVIEKCLEGGRQGGSLPEGPSPGILGKVDQERQTRHCAEGPEI